MMQSLPLARREKVASTLVFVSLFVWGGYLYLLLVANIFLFKAACFIAATFGAFCSTWFNIEKHNLHQIQSSPSAASISSVQPGRKAGVLINLVICVVASLFFRLILGEQAWPIQLTLITLTTGTIVAILLQRNGSSDKDRNKTGTRAFAIPERNHYPH